MKRRKFIQTLGGGLVLGNLLPDVLAGHRATRKTKGRKLFIVKLRGGNDGLNTLIPFADPLYAQNRPTLKVPRDLVLQLDEKIALHPNLPAFLERFKKRHLCILQGVGYEPPNRSHSRSADIWQSAITDRIDVTSGWLGRMAKQIKEEKTKDQWSFFHLGDGPNPLLFADAPFPVTSLKSIEELTLKVNRNARRILVANNTGGAKEVSSDADFLAAMTRAALQAESKVRDAAQEDSKGFPTSPFGKQLALAAKLSGAFPGHQAFFCSLDGFDTHAGQNTSHPILLVTLDRALKPLLRTLDYRGDDYAILVYSEFGRRVKENASRGTDHGVAGPVFLFGNKVLGGLFGSKPRLDDLINGDLRPEIDFRNVYREVLSGFFGASTRAVARGKGEEIRLFRK